MQSTITRSGTPAGSSSTSSWMARRVVKSLACQCTPMPMAPSQSSAMHVNAASMLPSGRSAELSALPGIAKNASSGSL